MSDPLPTLRAIDWRSVTPWGVLFRVPMLAAGLSVLLLGIVGVIVSAAWWALGGWALGDWALSLGGDDWHRGDVYRIALDHDYPGRAGDLGTDLSGVLPVALHYLEPARAIVRVSPEGTLPRFAYLVWGCLGSLVIWGCLGGAITRIALMRLGRDEHVGITRAVRFAVRRLPSLVASALYPLGLLIPLALVGMLFGLMLRSDIGAAALSLVWGIGLLVTMVCAVVVLGVWLGWPLMIATVSAEGTDSLDGLSRGFAYVFQRPVHYAFYLVVSWVLSVFAVMVMGTLIGLIGDLAWWSVSWGAGTERVIELRQFNTTFSLFDDFPAPDSEVVTLTEGAGGTGEASRQAEPQKPSASLQLTQSVFHFWDATLGTALNGFRFGLFWCFVAGIYLLLRQQVDETEFDEIYIEPAATKSLPDLDAPAPEVETKPASSAEGSSGAASTAGAVASAAVVDSASASTAPAQSSAEPAPASSPESETPAAPQANHVESPEGQTPGAASTDEPDDLIRDE